MQLLDSNATVSAASVRGEFTGANTAIFRAFCLAMAMIASGCATQHDAAQPPLAVAAAPAASPAVAAAPGSEVDARRVAADAKKLNLEPVKSDGQVRYCRANVIVGSRFEKDRQCYTADQVEAMGAQAQQSSSR
jgi:hypothetical protein